MNTFRILPLRIAQRASTPSRLSRRPAISATKTVPAAACGFHNTSHVRFPRKDGPGFEGSTEDRAAHKNAAFDGSDTSPESAEQRGATRENDAAISPADKSANKGSPEGHGKEKKESPDQTSNEAHGQREASGKGNKNKP